MKTHSIRHVRGFTLIELLVVIAIIALVASLVVGLAGVAGERKKISRVQVERARLVTLIEAYHSKLGVYPPQNPNLNAPEKNTLVYELAGAIRHDDPNNNPLPPSDPNYYTTPLGNISSNILYSVFGIGGVINASSDDPTDIKRVLKNVKPDQVASLSPGTLSLVVPVDGPVPNGRPNPWKYATGTNAVHNPGSFDLWVQIVVRGKTNTLGNWKD